MLRLRYQAKVMTWDQVISRVGSGIALPNMHLTPWETY